MELVIIGNRRCDMILGGGRFDVSVCVIHGTGIFDFYLPIYIIYIWLFCMVNVYKYICTMHVSYGACFLSWVGLSEQL